MRFAPKHETEGTENKKVSGVREAATCGGLRVHVLGSDVTWDP